MKAPTPWIPEVADVARRLHEETGSASYSQRVCRLGTAPRLAKIWKELDGRGKTKLPTMFMAACCEVSGTVKREQLIEKAHEYRAVATKLLGYASRFDEGTSQKQILRDASKVLTELANKTQFYESPLVVTRQMDDAEVRGYVVLLSIAASTLYGTPLDKVVAEIATVAFDLKKPVSVRNVQFWRKYPGDIEETVKNAKNAL